ncbi:MAG: hypothetical protein MI920_05740 [Kiloniellales bacterium]|nr:hypothetical protein [Kiloniellales bacterium]
MRGRNVVRLITILAACLAACLSVDLRLRFGRARLGRPGWRLSESEAMAVPVAGEGRA